MPTGHCPPTPHTAVEELALLLDLLEEEAGSRLLHVARTMAAGAAETAPLLRRIDAAVADTGAPWAAGRHYAAVRLVADVARLEARGDWQHPDELQCAGEEYTLAELCALLNACRARRGRRQGDPVRLEEAARKLEAAVARAEEERRRRDDRAGERPEDAVDAPPEDGAALLLRGIGVVLDRASGVLRLLAEDPERASRGLAAVAGPPTEGEGPVN